MLSCRGAHDVPLSCCSVSFHCSAKRFHFSRPADRPPHLLLSRFAPPAPAVLETWWCLWDTSTNGPDPANCCTNDMPSIAGLTSLLTKLLALPPRYATPQQRADWTDFLLALPPLPVTKDGAQLAPADELSPGTHNVETPELYAVHPYRWVTLGGQMVRNVSVAPAIAAFWADGNAYNSNDGWVQSIIDAAYLGMTNESATYVAQRVATGLATGYRFPAYAPGLQDAAPSADHYANLMTAVNTMILQPVDDGYSSGRMLLFGAWPCEWDVETQLWGPLNTSVALRYVNGTMEWMAVNPPARASAVVPVNCVTEEGMTAALHRGPA